MRLTVNGNAMEVPDGTSVLGLLNILGMQERRVAVELNRTILSREGFAERMLAESDVLEVMGFVGGG